MALSVAGRNAPAGGLADAVTHASLHTADPGTTGANEVSGGGYARQTVDFAAPSGGSAAMTGTPVAFTGPATGACTHVGLWAGSTFLAGQALTGDQTFNAAGAYNLTGVTISQP